MRKGFICILMTIALLVFGSASSHAAGLETELNHNLLRIRSLVAAVQVELENNRDVAEKLVELKGLTEDIEVLDLLLVESCQDRQRQAAEINANIASRQQQVTTQLLDAVGDLLARLHLLITSPRITPGDLQPLRDLLNSILIQPSLPILGSLPYQNLHYSAVSPKTSPTITPAYLNDQTQVVEADLNKDLLTPEIVELARSLNWNPVKIYEWVQGNIESEWYWGAMKGSAETLRQRSGNDADQAALLVALMRASGYPSRFVRGAITFFPSLDKARNLTGLEDPLKIAAFFQKAGIPFEPLVSGGRIVNFKIEHVWVESQVPYSNYRGAVIDENGKIWVSLDTHIKPGGYKWNNSAALGTDFPLADVRDGYLAEPRTETPMEYLRAQLEQSAPGTPYPDYLRTKSQLDENLGILPSGLQFNTVAITGEYDHLPQDLRQTITFTAADPDGSELFNLTLDVSKVSNHQLVLSYEPETVADQRLIDSYGGLDNTPSYLVNLRPVLLLDGERLVVARSGMPMGDEYTLTITLGSPNGNQERTSRHIVGNLSAIGIVCQKAVIQTEIPLEQKNAARLLFEEALSYIDRWNASEEELAALLKVALVRPIPTVVTVGGVVEVTRLFDTPHDLTWKGVYIDAGLRRVETVAKVGQEDREKEFMRLSGLEGSILENRLFEDDFGVDSVSTAKLLALAPQDLTAVLKLDGSTADSILPTLDLAENVKADIENAVHQGQIVMIPEREMTYESWNGIGYIKEDPQTGEAGYMLSGSIAGGMTVWSILDWDSSVKSKIISEMLQTPNIDGVNTDPSAAYYIEKIPATDLQEGTVGEKLAKKLLVRVLDRQRKPVSGVRVVFTVKAGGGQFEFNKDKILGSKTGRNGVADATFVLGKQTSDNPTYWTKDYVAGTVFQVGANIVEAALPSGKKIAEPFTSFGFPGEPNKLIAPDTLSKTTDILTYAGTVAVKVADQYGNPIPGQNVSFDVLPAVTNPDGTCASAGTNPQPALLIPAGEACLDNAPNWRDCPGAFSQSLQAISQTNGQVLSGVILGGSPDSTYILRASADINATSGEAVAPVNFTFKTRAFGNCDGEGYPDVRMSLHYTYPIDFTGKNINAGKVGDTIPLKARLSALVEGQKTKEETVTCADGPVTCDKIIGNRNYVVETSDSGNTHILAPSLTFAGNGGTLEGGGIYTGNYVLKPGVNTIAVTANASLKRERTDFCPDCEKVTWNEPQHVTTNITVYGVDIAIDPVPDIIVDAGGHSLKDYGISYTIHPAEYKASNAYVVLYQKSGVTGLATSEPLAYLAVPEQGKGTATIARGFKFDMEKSYEFEVVLNVGSGVEIRSERKPLNVYGLILKDGENLVDLDAPYVFIKANPEPQMPQLTAQIVKMGTLLDQVGWGDGTIKWQLKVEFDRVGRTRKEEKDPPPSFVDYFPIPETGSNSVPRVLPASIPWDIRKEFDKVISPTGETTTEFRGGLATLIWSHGASEEKNDFVFYIRGKNPSREVFEAYVNGLFTRSDKIVNTSELPWFLFKMARHESASTDKGVAEGIYQQFNEKAGEVLGPDPDKDNEILYTPNWGPPDGWGIWQKDPAINAQMLWNWQENTIEGLKALEKKRTDAMDAWDSVKESIKTWNILAQKNYPGSEVDRIFYQKAKTDKGTYLDSVPFENGDGGFYGFDLATGLYTNNGNMFHLIQADWIKRYNGGKFIQTHLVTEKVDKKGNLIEPASVDVVEESAAYGKDKKVNYYIKEVCKQQ